MAGSALLSNFRVKKNAEWTDGQTFISRCVDRSKKNSVLSSLTIGNKPLYARQTRVIYQLRTQVLEKTKKTSKGKIVTDPFYKAYSKLHFQLTRNYTTTGCFTFIEDCSSNGTFVNGCKLGKGSKQFLSNNDEISICEVKNRLFVYMETVDEKENIQVNTVELLWRIRYRSGRCVCGGRGIKGGFWLLSDGSTRPSRLNCTGLC